MDTATRLWSTEASIYSFSNNLSMSLANAFAINVLGYGLVSPAF
ncbi:MAG: hypothetical protein N3E36_02965 [Sulfolobales archaeon]|nr:hypothetical protein [Sulfolobales archaeon]